MRVTPFARYIKAIRTLLDGEELDYPIHEGLSKPVRFQNLNRGYIDIEHRAPIYVGGFGPRAKALTGELGDGLITGISREGTIA